LNLLENPAFCCENIKTDYMNSLSLLFGSWFD